MNTKICIYLLPVLLLALVISCSDDTSYITMKPPSKDRLKKGTIEQKGPEITGAEEGPSENHPPVISKAELLLKSSGGRDTLKVEIVASDMDDDDVDLEYRWFRNGERVAGTGDTLSDFNRGDRIMVEAVPYDGLDYGDPKRTLEMEINNTSPRIIEHSNAAFDGKMYRYGVKAVDADGDKLTYVLKKGPKGMAIDAKTGLVSWEVPDDFTGSVEASVVVSDGHKGSVRYDFTASISGAPPKQ